MVESLYKLLDGAPAVSLVGMCKNAGKTTVLNHLLAAQPLGEVLALTSIGRDGESSDVVTGTKKPGIYVRKGTLFATAEKLLAQCDVTREILETTGMHTPLGEVVLLRALSDGNVQLAGPSMVNQLVEIKEIFWRYGAVRVVVDGALGRRTLSTRRLADAVVLCAGASCGPGVEAVVAGTKHICEVLMLPEVEKKAVYDAAQNYEGVAPFLVGEQNSVLKPGQDLAGGLREHKEDKIEAIVLPGALSDGLVKSLLASGADFGRLTFVVADASRVLLSAESYQKLLLRECRVQVLDRVNLAAVTINPFSAYGNHFDAAEFARCMREEIGLPVIDVEDEVI